MQMTSDNSKSIVPVILAGGSGSRLWPLSRESRPKQFLNLLGSTSLLQDTIKRVNSLNSIGLKCNNPIIICNQQHRFLVAEQIQTINQTAEIILEPEAKNTAPAITLAALRASQNGSDPILLILAVDHLIPDQSAFERAIISALPVAEQDRLVTFGIPIDSPEIGYGYIKMGHKLNENAYQIAAFIEKPDLASAISYQQQGGFLWNSGFFMFRASQYLNAITNLQPDILRHCQRSLDNSSVDLDFIRLKAEDFEKCESISIDHAVMEKASNTAVVPMNANWQDIGNWSSIWKVSEKDSYGNHLKGDVIVKDSSDCMVIAEQRLVSLLGLEKVMVVDTQDALLVAHQDRAEEVKNLADQLKRRQREEWEIHKEVFRPWGKYQLIAQGAGYCIKKILVKPGGRLSLQSHQHRAEHWVVTKGKAKVTLEDEQIFLLPSQSTFIPIGNLHSLENPSDDILELIEVQTGDFLCENDIVRVQDYYGRDLC